MKRGVGHDEQGSGRDVWYKVITTLVFILIHFSGKIYK